MFTTLSPKNRTRQRGQGMTEYIIIVALIAIATITVVTVFGNNIRAMFGTAANALTGTPNQLETKPVDDATKDLKNFGETQP